MGNAKIVYLNFCDCTQDDETLYEETKQMNIEEIATILFYAEKTPDFIIVSGGKDPLLYNHLPLTNHAIDYIKRNHPKMNIILDTDTALNSSDFVDRDTGWDNGALRNVILRKCYYVICNFNGARSKSMIKVSDVKED